MDSEIDSMIKSFSFFLFLLVLFDLPFSPDPVSGPKFSAEIVISFV